MSLETRHRPVEDLVSRPPRLPRALMLAGLAGACVAGAALGLWARPSDLERELTAGRQAPAERPAPQAAPRRIEIRVDRPIGAAPPPQAQPAPAEPPAARPVTARPLPAPRLDAPPAPAELAAPRRQPEGLMRVHAVAPVRLAESRPALRPPPPRPDPQVMARKRAKARAKALEAGRKAERLEKARRVAAAKARKAVDRQAAAPALAAAHPRKAKPAAAQLRAKAAKLADAKTAKAHAPQARPTPAARGSGPLRAAGMRCVSRDLGAALACADPAVGAADRELGRAYRQAQAAGVPASTLERQQQRWFAARAAAAREAPWAVHDVYVARIAELQDLARRAEHGD